jgi:hypothetical protein
MADSKLDTAAARKLVDEISSTLAKLPQDSAKHAELRAEVAHLKAMLAKADSASPEVEGKIRSVHSSLDNAATELQADGIRVGMFLSELGRILGLD